MRNVMITLMSAALMLLILAAAKSCLTPTAEAQAETEQAICPLRTPTPLVDPDADLRQHAAKSIALSNPKLSDARKKVIESLLVSVSRRVFSNRQHQRYWIALIGVESAYQGTARSNKGAIGLGQLMPAYKKDFGASCGLTDVTDEDIRDDFTNATLSACYFRSLIEANHGDLALALVSYNAGLASADYAKAKHGQQPSKEPREYRAKVTARAEATK